MAAALSTCYVSCGCNRVPHCLDWGENNIICYGSSNAVVIYDPQVFSNAGTIVCTAVGHTNRVNCTRWVKQLRNDAEIISTSSDKTAILWKYHTDLNHNRLTVICKFVGHTDVVNVADAINYTNGWPPDRNYCDRLVVTASSDSTVRLWAIVRNSDDAVCTQTIKLKSHFSFDVKLTLHPGTKIPLLVFGGSDTKLHFYAPVKDEFLPLISLDGHEDWIRALDVSVKDQDLLISSCAQDCFIRIWKLSQKSSKDVNSNSTIQLKDNAYTVEDFDGQSCSVVVRLDAILAGHENWIYGLHWHPPICIDGRMHQPLKLLSASMDKTMIIWEYSDELNMWSEKIRVGEVGGNTLGFFGNKFNPNGQSLIAHGYQGAFHMWHFQKETQQWLPGVTISGHFKEVRDLDWDPEGKFVVSVSLDQTTRLHAPWKINENESLWYEIARPQVHGYDITCIAMIGRDRFSSGADEKVLRAFQAPRNFVDNFRRLCDGDLQYNLQDSLAPEGASVPALGLSNKAVYEKIPPKEHEPKHPKDMYPEAYFVATELDEPPTEETLLQNTLWPEIQKLYGHGNEIYCIACNREGTLLASACKASKKEDAGILLWETQSWKNVAQLHGHNLTVTQMEFSPCDGYLLSVCRDRTWSVFGIKCAGNGLVCERKAYSDKINGIHSRIIWTCAWTHDSKYFMTGSRDKKVVVWEKTSVEQESSLKNWKPTTPVFDAADSVTAIAIAPICLPDNAYLLAIGLDNGIISLYKWTCQTAKATWECYNTFDNVYHHLCVTRLRFNPTLSSVESNDKRIMQLASCGADFAVRIYNVTFMY